VRIKIRLGLRSITIVGYLWVCVDVGEVLAEGISSCIKCKLVVAERNSRKRVEASVVSADLLMGLWERQGGRCAITGLIMNANGRRLDGVSLDHKTPIALNGLHVIENLQLVCTLVNRMKSSLSDVDFRLVMGEEGLGRLAGFIKRSCPTPNL
jgi:hypothetical protein